MINGKRAIYFDSLVEQHRFLKGHPVTAFTERTRKTDVMNFVSEDRIDKIDGNVVHIKEAVIVPDKKCIPKDELIKWLHEQIEENRNCDDNVLTRLGIAAGFQKVLDKYNN